MSRSGTPVAWSPVTNAATAAASGYLDALLTAEMEKRESRAITRLLHEARLPRMKTLESFEFDRSGVSAGQLRTLAPGATT